MNVDNLEELNIDEITERLHLKLNTKSDRALSVALGLAYGTVTAARKRNTLPWEAIIKVCKSKRMSFDELADIQVAQASKPQGQEVDSSKDVNSAIREMNIVIDRLLHELIAGSGQLTPDKELRIWKDIKPELIEKSMQFGLNEPVLRAIAQSAFKILIK